MAKSIFFIIFLSGSSFVFSQGNGQEQFQETETQKSLTRKKQMFVFWGWNRAFYTRSDISSRGGGYSFALNSMVATDIFTPFTVEDYFGLENLIIPQTNARIGCFTKDKAALMLRLDHVKYVMKQNQTVDFRKQIGNPKCAAMIKGGRVDLSDGRFLTFEHPDGPNCVNIGVEKYSVLPVSRYFDLNWSCGGGASVLIPKTDAKLFGFERSGRLHLAGFGLDMRSTQCDFVKHIMLRFEGKRGI